MCMLKSGLLFKGSAYVPDHDHHDQMLKEKGIADTAENRIAGKFVRFELNPPNGDPFAPLDTWRFGIDQDEKPEWLELDPEKYENMARKAVAKWAKKHIYIGVDGLEITEGCGYYLKDCKNVTLYGNSTVKVMCGNSTVEVMRDNSTVEVMRDNSTVKAMRDNSTVEVMWDNSTVEAMCGNSTVKAMWDNVNPDTVILSHNATIKDSRTKTIYCAEGWKLEVLPN